MEAAPLMSSAQADTRATWEACACMYMQAHKQTLDGETYLQTAARGMGRGREPLHLCSRVYFDPAVVFVFLFIKLFPPPSSTTSALTSGIGSLAPIPGGVGGGRLVQRNKEILDQLWVSN